MKVLAIDPGYDRMGVAILERDSTGREQLLFSTCIETNRGDNLPTRLHQLGTALTTIVTTHRPTCLAIETLYFNKNITTGIGVAQARGVALFIATSYQCQVYEFGPQEVKVAVTGYGNSDKAAVYSMAARLITNVPSAAKDDEYDAIAVGITCLAQHGRR